MKEVEEFLQSAGIADGGCIKDQRTGPNVRSLLVIEVEQVGWPAVGLPWFLEQLLCTAGSQEMAVGTGLGQYFRQGGTHFGFSGGVNDDVRITERAFNDWAARASQLFGHRYRKTQALDEVPSLRIR